MVAKVFPFLAWFKNYDKASLQLDALSGLTVALVLIPQSMAYAQLAGLPAYFGLYASFLPPMIAALVRIESPAGHRTGGGRFTDDSGLPCAPLATAGSPGYIAYAILLALMVGIFQLSTGHPAVGAGGQFSCLTRWSTALPMPPPSSSPLPSCPKCSAFPSTPRRTITKPSSMSIKAAVHYTHWPTLLIGGFAFAIMYGLKWLSPRIPNVLVAVVITTSISWATGFQHDRNVSASTRLNPLLSRQPDRTIQHGILRWPSLHLLKGEPDSVKHPTKAKQSHNESRRFGCRAYAGGDQPEYLARLQEEVHSHREQMQSDPICRRSFRPMDSLKFYNGRQGSRRPMESDGRTWRIKVGNEPLDTGKLKMMGGGAVVGTIPRGLPSHECPADRHRGHAAYVAVSRRSSRCWGSWKRFPLPSPWPAKPVSDSIPTRS